LTAYHVMSSLKRYQLSLETSDGHCLTSVQLTRICQFLPRDASAERGDATVSRMSVRPSVRDV